MSEWIAYNEIDPIGEWRHEFRTARLESLITNISSALYHKKGTKPVMTTPADFIPVWGKKKVTPFDPKKVAESVKRVFHSIMKGQSQRKSDMKRIPVAIQNRQKPINHDIR